MALGRQRAEWDRTSLLAMIAANPYRDPKVRKKPYTAADFHPFAEGRPRQGKKAKIKISVDCLKAICDK
jgi:hypothetical protein